MLPPLTFQPIPVERVWGGHELARFGRALPPNQLIGESWEISDRDDAATTVADGPALGQTLRQLIAQHGPALLGTHAGNPQRFPLLVKLLDARQRLSLQVHPPAAIATRLGGEPKTEMWYILDADPAAHLIAGLRRGVTRPQFEQALQQQRLETCVHRFPVTAGDAVFIPSGRLHAIDAGLVLVEIQQNSDTTYRVYDWGRPRPLHVAESLASINFADFEPGKVEPRREPRGRNVLSRLVEADEFHVHQLELAAPWKDRCDGTSFHILTGVGGRLGLRSPGTPDRTIGVGEFVLLPASLGDYTLTPLAKNGSVLKTFLPRK